jgi:hypothetical protein
MTDNSRTRIVNQIKSDALEAAAQSEATALLAQSFIMRASEIRRGQTEPSPETLELTRRGLEPVLRRLREHWRGFRDRGQP